MNQSLYQTGLMRAELGLLTLLAAANLQAQTAITAQVADAAGHVQLDNVRQAPGAQEGSDTASALRVQARQRFEAGMKLYEEGDFSLALLEFERAYALIPEYRVLYNIGQLNIQLGRYARAVRRLRQYLTEAGGRISAERRTSVEADLEMLAARTATLFVQVNVDGAEVSLDNDNIAKTPMHEPVLVDAGEHRLVVRRHGFETHAETIALTGRDNAAVTLRLTPEPQAPPIERTVFIDQTSVTPERAAAIERAQLLAVGWVGAGLLGAAWAASGYMGYHTDRKRDERLQSATTTVELNQLKREARNWYVAADIFGALTLGATGGLLYFTLAGPKRPVVRNAHSDTSLEMAISPRQCALRVSF